MVFYSFGIFFYCLMFVKNNTKIHIFANMEYLIVENSNIDSIIGITTIEESSEELLSRLEKKENYLPVLAKMSEHRKREWLSARVLLKELLGEEKEIRYTDSGKPYLADCSSFISISHTKGYVAVIVNKERPVAIDIEQIASRVERVRTRYMNATEEQNLSKENPLIHLLLHWSAKESLFKWMDESDINFQTQLHIHPFEPKIDEWAEFTAHETRTDKQQEFRIHNIVTDKYVLTVIE